MLRSFFSNTVTWKLFWVMLLLSFMFIPVYAAILDYNFTSTTGTYSEITGGTEMTLLNGTTYVDDQKFLDPTILGGGSATTGPGLPIGFNFTFNENVFDVIGINANGWISFGQSSLGAGSVNMATTSAYTSLSSTTVITPAQLTNRISALNRDIQAQVGSGLRMETLGSAPNRICVVQWTNFKRYSTNGTGDNFNFQIKLYETSNKVEIVYGSCVSGSTVTATTITYQVGLRGPAVSDFNARTTTDNWSATTSGDLNTATCQLDQVVFPATGLTFAWNLSTTPTAPNPATLILPLDAATGVSSTPLLSWSSGGGQPTGYRLFVGTDNPPTNLINNQDLQNASSYVITTPLSFLTTYYWKVVPYNTNGQAQNCPVWSFTIQENDVITPPYIQDFNATSFPPNFWTRYSGIIDNPSSLTATTSGWVRTANFGNVTNSPNGSGTKMNIYSTNKYWLVTPPIDLGTGAPKQLEFDLALTDYANANPIENDLGTDDRFAVVISTDNGVTWTSTNILRLWDNDESTTSEVYNDIVTAGQRIVINLSAYSGLVKIAFYGESTVSNVDNDLHIDNVTVIPVPTAPIYLAVPASKDFSNIQINNSSSVQNFIISNMGIGTLVINTIAISGTNASEFTLVNNNTLPCSIVNGQPITIGASFNPSSIGNKSANIELMDSQGRVLHSIPLTGVGYDATITVFPHTENFDTLIPPALALGWEKIVTGTSSGNVDTYTSSSAGIVYSEPNVARILNSGDSSGNYLLISPPVQNLNQKRVKFFARGSVTNIPLKVGFITNYSDVSTFTEISSINLSNTHTEYLVSMGNAPAGNCRLAFKHGNGATYQTMYLDDVLIENLPTTAEFAINTTAIDYGNVYVNRSAIFPVIITNNGQAPLNVNWTLPTGITINPVGPTICNSGQSITVNVSLLATIDQMGAYAQNIVLATNASNMPSLSIPVTANILAPLPEGLIEVGNGTTIEMSLPIEPYFRYSYSQSIYLANQLNINENQRIIQVAYNYNGFETFSDSIKIYMANTSINNFNSPNTWIPIDQMQLVYEGLLTTVAEAGWLDLDLTNYFNYTAGSNLAVAVYEFTGGNYHSNASEFFCTTMPDSRSIEYHNDTTIPDPANPPALTRKSAIPNIRFLFTPLPTGPLFYVSPSAKDFGLVHINLQSPYQTFNIRNIGIGSLTINSIQLVGTNADQFQLVNTNTLPLSLGANASATIQVKFAPTSIGSKTATIQVTDNLTRTVRTINLVGIAYDATITAFPHTENFDTVIVPALPLGWQALKNSTSSTAYIDTYSSTTEGIPNSMPNTARIANSSDANAELLLISPFIQNANQRRVKFFARGASAGYQLSVGYITNPLDASTYTELSLINLSATHTEYIVSLAGLTAGNKQIAFRHALGGTSRTIYVDDVTITNLPVTPEFAINPLSLELGTMFANNTRIRSVNITNNGSQPLTVSWTLPALVTINPAGTTTIVAGQTSTVQVTFAPTVSEVGDYSQNIILATNDPAIPSFTLPITATVLAPLPTGLYQVGEGVLINQGLPIEPYYRYSYSQTIYKAEDLPNVTGLAINQLGYEYNGHSAFEDSVHIYMGYTTMNDFTSPNTYVPYDSLQLVYSGLLTTTTEAGWIMLELNPSFEFTAGRNLVVAIHEFTGGNFHSSDDEFYCTSASTPMAIEYHNDTTNPDPINPPTPTRKNAYPNTRFFIGTNYPRPTNLTANAGNGLVNLSWTAPNPGREAEEIQINTLKKVINDTKKKNVNYSTINNDSPNRMILNNYKVYRNNLEIALIPSNTTNYTDSDVANGTTYSYKITALYSDPTGESFPSNTATATPEGSILNPPVGLTASMSGANVQLNWINGELKINENFNTSTLPDNWTLMDIDGDNNNWISSAVNPHSGQRCIESMSTGLNPNNWLITPQITLGNNPVLSWWVGGSSGEQLGDQYRIYVSTTTATEFTAQLYQEILTTGDWTRKSLDLSAYANQNIYLAFVHRNSANKLSVRLDDIAVSSSISPAKCATKSVVERNHLGYRIYRDNVQISQVSPSTLSYIDVNPIGSLHTYFVTSIYDEGESCASNFVNITNQDENILPTTTMLKGNYPNPFNPITLISFDLAKDQMVNIEIYNIKGQKVKTLLNENKKAGTYRILWNGLNDNNNNVGSGIYFYRMKSGNYTSTGKMILMK